MTFLENLEPLLAAAERYAEVARSYEIVGDYGLLIAARDRLLEAAIEFAKWGDANDKTLPRDKDASKGE